MSEAPVSAFHPPAIGPLALRSRTASAATREDMTKMGLVSKGLARFHAHGDDRSACIAPHHVRPSRVDDELAGRHLSHLYIGARHAALNQIRAGA